MKMADKKYQQGLMNHAVKKDNKHGKLYYKGSSCTGHLLFDKLLGFENMKYFDSSEPLLSPSVKCGSWCV